MVDHKLSPVSTINNTIILSSLFFSASKKKEAEDRRKQSVKGDSLWSTQKAEMDRKYMAFNIVIKNIKEHNKN